MSIPFKSIPRAQQLEALDASEGKDAFAYFMTMRTGKTKVTLDDAARAYLDGRINTLLVLAPNGVQRQWVEQADTHCCVPYDALFYCGGLPMRQTRAFTQLADAQDHPKLKILTLNIESAANASGKALILKILKQNACMMVVDESTRIKSASAATTKSVLKFGLMAQMRRILNGTPITQSPLDLYAQFAFLDPAILGHRTYTSFRARYAVMKRVLKGAARARVPSGVDIDSASYAQLSGLGLRAGRDFFDQVTDYRNLPELEQRIAPYVYRIERADVTGLPPIVQYTRDVVMPPEQRRIYRQMEDDACAHIGVSPDDLLSFFMDEGKIEAGNALSQLLRAQQILGGYVSDASGNLCYVKHNRLRVLHDVLEEVDGKVIIWARFRPEIQEIAASLQERYGESSVAQFHGGISQSSREVEKRRFQTVPGTRFLVGQAAAGGVGQTFDAADTIINYSNDYSLYTRLQSMERATSFGKKSIAVIDLVCRGTIDEKILVALERKRAMADAFDFSTRNPTEEYHARPQHRRQ